MTTPNDLGFLLIPESCDNRIVLDNTIVFKGPIAEILVEDGPFDLATGNSAKARVTADGLAIENGSIPLYEPTPMTCFEDYLWTTRYSGAVSGPIDVRMFRFNDIVFMKLPTFNTTSGSLPASIKIYDALPDLFKPQYDQQLACSVYVNGNQKQGVAFIDSRFGTIDIYPIDNTGLLVFPATTANCGTVGSVVRFSLN